MVLRHDVWIESSVRFRGGANLNLTNDMSSYIPLISSGVAGPLGVLHLPRLWQKASLAAVGKLHSDYPALAPGYDTMVLGALGISPEAFGAYINSTKPTYPQCEAWVLEQCGGKLDAAAIEQLNSDIRGYHHKDETRAAILSANGIPDEGKILDAVNLNNLDDWYGFHQEVIGG